MKLENSMIADFVSYNENRDNLSYPPIPGMATLFQSGLGYLRAAKVHWWEWSDTFGKWGAYVTFGDGSEMYTFPCVDDVE